MKSRRPAEAAIAVRKAVTKAISRANPRPVAGVAGVTIKGHTTVMKDWAEARSTVTAYTARAVPEPSAFLLRGTGVAMIAGVRSVRRTRKGEATARTTHSCLTKTMGLGKRRVLLVGWDAADWKVIQPLIDSGKMPHTKRLVENGAMARLATLHPPLSPMLWTSIATGKRPFKHGIHGFSEPTPDGLGIQPVSNLSRTCKTVWNIFNQNDLRSTVIGWWPSHPAEPLNGVMVSDHFHRATGPIRDKSGSMMEVWPPLPGSVYPPELMGTLAELRFHPDEVDPQMVAPFIPRYAEIDQDKDIRLASLMKILCECVTVHSAATWLIENQPWDFFTVYYDAIDHFSHGFMKYHPPRQDWIPEDDFDMFHRVVNMAYQFHDQMLGTLLQKAGPDVTVMLMSDHGFHADHLRPRHIPDIPAGPAIEHSELGIFVVSGPGIKKDELLFGASVLDIAPTLLTLYGLPVGQDMDGRTLTSAFDGPTEVKSIPSWDEVPGNDGRHSRDTLLDPIASREALEQMVALGYIEKPDENGDVAVRKTVEELRYNLGEAYQDDARHREAAEIFQELYAAEPDEVRFAVRYFVSCEALGRLAEMRAIVDDLDGRRREVYEKASQRWRELRAMARERRADAPEPKSNEAMLTAEEKTEVAESNRLMRYSPALVSFLKAQVLTGEKRYEEALECLSRIGTGDTVRPGLLLKTGELFLRLGRFRDARRTYKRALEIDPDNHHAHAGLCRLDLRRRRYEAAADHAMNCLQRAYMNPLAHHLLGRALRGLGEFERAAKSFRIALAQNPNFPQAHLRLADLLEEDLGDAAGADKHRRLARRIRRAAQASTPGTGRVATPPDSPAWTERKPTVPLSESLVVVTGLPRSGTSMLMQMLEAGGMPVLTDGLRTADEDNPRGYLEFEPVKNLGKDAAWLVDAKGKAVKIVTPLLQHIPAEIPVRVVLIERDLNEILNSQTKMIERRGENVPQTLERRERLKNAYRQNLRSVAEWSRKRPNASLLAVQRMAVLEDPEAQSARISEFLGGALDARAMAEVVDPALHRNRSR